MIKSLLKIRQSRIQNKVNENLFEKYKEYIHNRHYSMLKNFSQFCKKHDIQFWLHGGTLIGAYFHQGIIPWDDDLDVAMTREDWNKLVALNPIWDDMILQNYNSDSGFNSVKFYKLRDIGTYLNDGRYWSSKSNDYQGLFIDIFVYDSTNKSEFNKLTNREKIVVYTQIVARAFFEIFHILPFEKKLRKKLRKYERWNENDKYIREDIRSINKDNKNYFFEKEDVFPLKKMLFGDDYYFVPKNTKNYLERQYRNLVKYPNKENRKPTHIIEFEVLVDNSDKRKEISDE